MQEKTLEQDEQKDAVLMMTLHAAKGLEFHTVIIVGMEDGLLPSSRSFVNSDSLEEERRLFYVGVTRAQERLLLTHSKYRYTYGQMTTQRPSRFLAELPTNRFLHHDCSNDRAHQFSTLFLEWFGLKAKTTKSQVFTFGSAKKVTRKFSSKTLRQDQDKQKCLGGWKKKSTCAAQKIWYRYCSKN